MIAAVLFVHEHAETNIHKSDGTALLMAGHLKGPKAGVHSRLTGTIAELYPSIADNILDLGWGVSRKLSGIRA